MACSRCILQKCAIQKGSRGYAQWQEGEITCRVIYDTFTTYNFTHHKTLIPPIIRVVNVVIKCHTAHIMLPRINL